MNKLYLYFCKDCTVAHGADYVHSLNAKLSAELSEPVEASESACLGPCDKPIAMAIQSNGGAGYIFSGIDPEKDEDDIVATCRTYFSSNRGWIEDARTCGRLRHCLVARLPS